MSRAVATRRLSLAAALLVAALGPACKGGEGILHRVDGVAQINGNPVTTELFGSELAFALKASGGGLPQTDEEVLAFKRAALDELIDRMLVLAAARDANINVPSEKVDRELLKLKAEYHGSSFSEALAEGQLSEQELRERTRERLVMERYFVDEVFSRVAVTDAELEEYFRANAEQFAQPEQVRAAQIVVDSLEAARKVQNELRQGLDFDTAARRFSLSPDARVGGDLGYFKRGVMPEVFDRICFNLQPGKVSEIASSEYGFHLFKVLDKRPAAPRQLEQVRGEVEKRLLRSKQEIAQRERLQQLRQRANVQIDEAALAAVPIEGAPSRN
jgi:parvulin-like peptidyl-prolyl isomerase